MQRMGFLALSLLVTRLAVAEPARAPDLNLPEVHALRTEFLERRDVVDQKRRMVLAAMLSKQIEDQRQQQRQAKIRGNTTRHADAVQAVQLFEAALTALEKEDRFSFPKNVRPALERMLDLCTRALDAEDEARVAAKKTLDGQFLDRFGALLAQQGVQGLDRQQVQALWQAVVEGAGPAAPAADTAVADAPSETPPQGAGSPAAPADDTVLHVRGTAADWVPLAHLEFTVQAMEIITLPLLDLTEVETRTGTGLESGATWRASLKPVRLFARPTGAPPAMRLRAVPGHLPVDVVEWPSLRNDWSIIVRVRPTAGGSARYGGLLEIDAAIQPPPSKLP